MAGFLAFFVQNAANVKNKKISKNLLTFPHFSDRIISAGRQEDGRTAGRKGIPPIEGRKEGLQ